MSVAFTREEDYESVAANLPDRPVSPHPNLVTPEGLAALEAELASARAAYASAQGGDVKDDRTAMARATRYLRTSSAWSVMVDAAYARFNGLAAAAASASKGSTLAARFGVPTHFDAVAALGYVPLSLTDSGASALSISAHKVGGPVGIGALAVARGTTIVPLIHGGSQQFLRSGSLDVAGTIAAAVAISRATSDVESHAARLADLRDYLRDGLLRVVPDATVRGSETHRVAGNLHVTIPGVDSAYLLFALDEAGFSVSAGSACTAGVESESHVLRAIGASDARGALRMTLGVTNTREEIDEFLHVLPGLIDRVRGIGSV